VKSVRGLTLLPVFLAPEVEAAKDHLVDIVMSLPPEETLLLPTLACAVCEGCVVYVGGRAMSPSDADWTEYMRFIDAHQVVGREMRGLILERGFGPTIRQRQQLQAATSKVKVRVAILTNSVFARGITVMVALVKPGYKAFAFDAIDDALRYLRVGAEDAPAFKNALRVLETKLERARSHPPSSPLY
jgi:hypothetical protein